MGEIVYSAMVSIDGYVEDRNGDIGWSNPPEDLHRFANETAKKAGAMIYGRRIYEAMDPFWPDWAANPTGPDYVDEFARLYVKTPKIVYSRTLESLPEGYRLYSEVNPEEVRSLKEEFEGEIGLGGAELAAEFARHGLIDIYELMVQPVILGDGKPMFGEELTGEMELAGTTALESGCVVLRYRPVRSDS